ncbi:MAG: VOC family protein [Phycisphaeraceae bacterium]
MHLSRSAQQMLVVSEQFMDMPDPRLNLVVIRSPDIDRAVEFYRALGLEFKKHAHGTGPQHYACEWSAFVLELYPLPDGAVPTTGTRIGFAVNSVDETVAKLVAIGGTIISPPADSPWGRRAVVADFDGHRVELTSAIEGAC